MTHTQRYAKKRGVSKTFGAGRLKKEAADSHPQNTETHYIREKKYHLEVEGVAEWVWVYKRYEMIINLTSLIEKKAISHTYRYTRRYRW